MRLDTLDDRAMGFATLAVSVCLIVVVASQGILYDSSFIDDYGLTTSTEEWMTKYETMVTNLNKDTTLKAQKARAANFLNKNWKNLKGIRDKEQLGCSLKSTARKLETRWRIVTFYKNILAKIKPKLGEAKFIEIKKKLWDGDSAGYHDATFAFDMWEKDTLAAIPDAATKTEISKIITNQEKAYTTFDCDKTAWLDSGFGFNRCLK